MEKIASTFNEYFSNWNIRLPPDAVAQRQRGKIVQSGWAIWYLFGADEKGEYLDYYASHRMTGDEHVRIYSSGITENLPAIRGMRICSADPVEEARLEAAYIAGNQAVSKMLTEKGFGLDGDEPGGVQINRFLHLGKPEA